MPSVFSHFLILDQAKPHLSPEQIDILEHHAAAGYWGSVGPDYFYFFEQDWSVAGDVSEFYFSIYDDLEEVLSIFEAAKSFREDVENWITGGLSGATDNVSQRLKVLRNALIAKYLTSNVDFFEQFTPPISSDASIANVKNWWLADLAHQRKTVDYAKSLWRHSQDDKELRAYALGYLTHVGGDASGHPVVNLLVGGPYRSHWRRHGFVEKAHDSYYWKKFKSERLSASSAHKLIEMQSPSPGMLPDMPGKMVDLIQRSIEENYTQFSLENGLPDGDSINNMYRLYYRYLRSSSTLGGINMPPPEEFDWFDLPDFIADELDKTWSKKPTGGLPPISNALDPKKWKSFFAAIIRSALWLTEVAIKILTLPVAMIARLTTAPARYVLWLMEQAIYDLYKDLRWALALGGFIHPEPEQVQRRLSELVQPTRFNYYADVYGFRHYQNREQTYHLVHPSEFTPYPDIEEPQELPIGEVPSSLRNLISSGNASQGGEALERLFFDPNLSQGAKELFDSGHNFKPLSGSPTTTARGHPIPSAVAASVYLIQEFDNNGARSIPNINLDGDRGYLWPTWEASQPSQSWSQLGDFKFRDW